MATERLRNFSFIIYEDRSPNWRKQLQDLHVCSAVSPLHDQDVYDEDFEGDEEKPAHKAGDPKEPHRHGLLMFDGKKSVTQVLKMLEPLNVKWIEPVNSLRGYSRYLCHLDEPQDVPYPKHVYDISDIELFCGASIDLSKALSGEELKRVRAEVLNWIRDNSITEYADVVDYALEREPDWLEYVCNKTIFLQGYLRSVRGKNYDAR